MARAFDTGGTTLRVLAACFNAIMTDHKAKIANGNNRPSVLNMSISGNKTTTEEKLITDLINAGIVVVAAAGNSTLNMDAIGVEISPAEVLPAITVGAIDIKDRIATFSNYGSAIDIFAPGVSILGASNTSDTGTKRYSGTSMAAPHTAGVVCQKLEGEPIYTTGLEVKAVHDWVIGSSTPNRVAFSTQVAATATPNRILFSEFSMNEVAVASEEVIVDVETWMVKVLTKIRNFLDKLIFLFK
jgi:subtilisin family serine protease